MNKKSAHKPSGKGGFNRLKKYAICLLILAVIYASVHIFAGLSDKPGIAEDIPEGYLAVHYIDIGQGDSELIITPDGHSIIIDTGPYESRQTLCRYLYAAGVSSIDIMILTHPHSDHIGGAAEVLGRFDVKEIIMPDAVNNTSLFEKLIEKIEDKGKNITIPETGDKRTAGGLTLEFFVPDFAGEGLNDVSIVTKATYGETSFLFTGDTSELGENELLKTKLPWLKSDVLKVAHHGSGTSSSEKFLKAVRPGFAVISCGANNDYSHPHRVTLDKLEKLGIDYHTTSRDGTAVLASDGNEIIIVSRDNIRVARKP